MFKTLMREHKLGDGTHRAVSIGMDYDGNIDLASPYLLD